MREEKNEINRKIKSSLQRTSKKQNGIEERGVTLITLVITIIILMILATVSINVVLGEGGLIYKAKQAKDLTEQAVLDEQQSLNTLMSEYANVMAEDQTPPEPPIDPTDQTPTPIGNVTKGEIFDETTKVSDANGDILYVPGGFGIATDSPNEIDDGIVITNNGDTKQFVWIPVNDESLGKMYNTTGGEKQLVGVTTKTSIYSKLRVRSEDSYTETTPGNESGIREPDVLSSYDTDPKYYNEILEYASTKAMADAMVEEYNTTYQSIAKYDGFYIGRYEITGNVDNPTVQRGGTVINSQNWYNLKKACTNVVSTEYAQSTMVYGNQWDEVMAWLIATGDKTETQVNENSADWGNYSDSTGTAATNSGSPQTAGKNEAWQANNIYDLAGNCSEWTQEAYNTYNRVSRGGDYGYSGSSGPASDRFYNYPYSSSYRNSSRPALYVALNAE